jgi:hypothetical protein
MKFTLPRTVVFNNPSPIEGTQPPILFYHEYENFVKQ